MGARRGQNRRGAETAPDAGRGSENLKKIGSLMTQMHPELGARARLLGEMTASARSRLAPRLARHCWIGGFDARDVTLITDQPHFAMHLRHHQREIIKQLNEEFSRRLHRNFTRIIVKVASQPLAHPRQLSERGV